MLLFLKTVAPIFHVSEFETTKSTNWETLGFDQSLSFQDCAYIGESQKFWLRSFWGRWEARECSGRNTSTHLIRPLQFWKSPCPVVSRVKRSSISPSGSFQPLLDSRWICGDSHSFILPFCNSKLSLQRFWPPCTSIPQSSFLVNFQVPWDGSGQFQSCRYINHRADLYCSECYCSLCLA